MARARRNGDALSLIAIDLDRFKRINDEYGHDLGDLVLQAFAETARHTCGRGRAVSHGRRRVRHPAAQHRQSAGHARSQRLRQAIETTPVSVGQDVSG
ncbi:diguanylate cyclase [Billgrantia gudaonensis]|uniref:Diguanylate cyclase n=1 Tax=Billgrantia gudaonensis TaxID=376427 RepID=A0A3S0QFN2_9GAMM|nr:diguanylate cyclase [Halomonas gudaonensis]